MKDIERESLGAVHTHTHTIHLLNNKNFQEKIGNINSIKNINSVRYKEKVNRINNVGNTENINRIRKIKNVNNIDNIINTTNIKQNNGITLIALIITIIVLLILAGVSIAMLTGQNGVLTQAQNAKSETEKAATKESLEIKMLGAKTENNTNSIEEILSEVDNVEITSKTKEGILLKCNGYPFFIDNDKNVSEISNLVTNGFLEKHNNTNFPNLNYANGFLTTTTSTGKMITSSEMIAVNTNKKYLQSVTMRANNQTSRNWSGLIQYDIDKKEILSEHCLYKQGSTTYLTQDLNNGDTEIHLNDVSGFEYVNATVGEGVYNGIIIWNYKDSTGYQYPEETYSRNVYGSIIEKDNVDKTNNVIKLTNPWSYGKIEKGTKLSQALPGGGYNYGILGDQPIASDWKIYTNIISQENYLGEANDSKFRAGTKYVQFVTLMNWYSNIPDTTIDVKDIIFTEIN